MDSMKKDSEDADAVSLLGMFAIYYTSSHHTPSLHTPSLYIVVGTEAKQILILPADPTNSLTLCKLTLPDIPSLLSIQGIFDVEWRISVICRDNKLYSIKNGEVRGSALLVGMAVDLGRYEGMMYRWMAYGWIHYRSYTMTL
jgi:hypothetical protein